MHLVNSTEYRENKDGIFRKIECKGFSYNFYSNMIGFKMNLKKCINLRFALTADGKLFYPNRVASYIKNRNSYYTLNNYPAIAFSLGRVINKRWYIFIIQSDLIPHSPSFIRDHFRGWRKVLLYNIIFFAIKKQIDRLYLNTPDNINKYYSNSIGNDDNLYYVLSNIYTKTAYEFNMNLVSLREPIDIQLYPNYCELLSKNFYELKVTGDIFFKEKRLSK